VCALSALVEMIQSSLIFLIVVVVVGVVVDVRDAVVCLGQLVSVGFLSFMPLTAR
jgi:hypothetical protein